MASLSLLLQSDLLLHLFLLFQEAVDLGLMELAKHLVDLCSAISLVSLLALAVVLSDDLSPQLLHALTGAIASAIWLADISQPVRASRDQNRVIIVNILVDGARGDAEGVSIQHSLDRLLEVTLAHGREDEVTAPIVRKESQCIDHDLTRGSVELRGELVILVSNDDCGDLEWVYLLTLLIVTALEGRLVSPLDNLNLVLSGSLQSLQSSYRVLLERLHPKGEILKSLTRWLGQVQHHAVSRLCD